MTAFWAGLVAAVIAAPPAVDSRFEQLAPAPAIASDADAVPLRRVDVTRAAVLIHGLRPQPVSSAAAARAEPSHWENPHAPVVQALKADADVYAFHYAQTTPLDDVARLPTLARAVRLLREAGYLEIVLIGYSAGGVIARQFVEDESPCGVTKVIQVCAPNAGSHWSFLRYGVRHTQAPFVHSLAKPIRGAALADRVDRRIPAGVEFVCIVAAVNWVGDGVVRRDAQWPADLQAQGVPAEAILIPHVGAMYSSRMSALVARLARTTMPRWSPDKVAAARPKILGWFAKPGDGDSQMVRE